MLGSLVEKTPPAELAVSVAALKSYLHGVAEGEEDTDLEALINAAAECAETALDQQLITATWELVLPRFPGAVIELRPPLQSVTSVKYYDENNEQQTWSSDEYEADTDHKPGRLRPAHGYSWPTTYSRLDAVAVRFVCGYGDTGADLPANLSLAIKALTAHWYEYRGMILSGTIVAQVPASVERLLAVSAHGTYA